MTELLFGRAGSGKTTEIFKRLFKNAEDKKTAYLIVPEQQALSAEKALLKTLPPSAQLNIEVLNFTRLANKVFRKYGGLSYNYATSSAKALIMWKNLKELIPVLKEYSNIGITSQNSFSENMLSSISEFKAYCITPHDLEKAAVKVRDNSVLSKKLMDLSLIYASYENMLNEKYDDTENDLTKLAELLDEHNFFENTDVYIDSFTDYTAQEYRIIEQIMKKADNTVISVGADSPTCKTIHFENIINTSDKIHKIAKKLDIPLKITKLDEIHRTKSSSLLYLNENLWRFDIDCTRGYFQENSDDIILMSCADPYSEAQAAANYINENIQNGKRYRDFVVVFRDASKYIGIIDGVFDKCNIPYFLSEKTDLSTKPLIKLILSALRIKLYNFKKDDVISYLRTGLTGVNMRDTDMFEEYIGVWNIVGNDYLTDEFLNNPDGYTDNQTSRGEKILSSANNVLGALKTQLLAFFTALENAKNTSEMCEGVYIFTQQLNIAEKLENIAKEEIAAGRKKQADECLKIYNIFLEALDELALVFGEEKLSCEEFFTVLRFLLSQTDIGTIPTRADEVIIGSASMLRAENVKNVLVLGLCEGEFPQNIKDSNILSDNEREVLSGVGIDLSKNNELRSADELYYIYRAMTMCQDSLFCSYTRSGADGKGQNPSIALLRLKLLFPDIPIQSYEELPSEQKLWSLDASLEYILNESTTPYGKALLKYCSEHKDERYKTLLDAIKTPITQADEKVSPKTVDLKFNKEISLSQSRIDKYIRCHFSFYCENILALRNVKKAEFRRDNIGTFIHKILESFLLEATDSEGKITIYQKDKIEQIINRIIDDYIYKILPPAMCGSNRIKHLIIRLRRLSLLLVDNLFDELSKSEFHPTFFELNITDRRDDAIVKPFQLVLKDGTKVKISGICDRVDTYKKDNKLYVRVVDYKTGSKTFSLSDIQKGLNIQLVLYLIAICKSKPTAMLKKLGLEENTEIIPAGVMYLSSNIPTITLNEIRNEDEVISMATDKLTRSGLILNDEEIVRAINKDINPNFTLAVKTDKDGNIKGKALTSQEEFEKLFSDLNETLCQIAITIKTGEASAIPLLHDNKYPCEYCDMKNICRASQK